MNKIRILCGTFPLIAWAIPARSATFLEVTPSVVELVGLPGETLKGQLTVKNAGDTQVLVSVDSRDGWKEQSGTAGLPLADWLFLKNTKKFVLAPKGERKLPYKVKIPSHFKGETLAFVFFSGPSTGGGLGIQLRQGIPIYMAVRGTETAELRLESLKPYFNAKKELEFSFELRLDGNVHVRPRGVLYLQNARGETAGTLEMDYGQPIFPGRKRVYFARGKQGNWVPGKYTVDLVLTYGENFGSARSSKERRTLTIAEDGNVLVDSMTPAEAPSAP